MNEPLIERIVMGVVIVLIAVLAIMVLLGMTGCTVISPSNELRVSEYDGSGMYATATGEVRGVRVTREKDVEGCLRFAGQFSTYESAGCAQ